MLKQLYPALLTCDHVIRDIARKSDQNERQKDEKTPVIYKLYYSQYNSLQKLSITSKDTSKWNNLLSRFGYFVHPRVGSPTKVRCVFRTMIISFYDHIFSLAIHCLRQTGKTFFVLFNSPPTPANCVSAYTKLGPPIRSLMTAKTACVTNIRSFKTREISGSVSYFNLI